MEFLKKTGLYFVGNMASKIMTALLVPVYAFYVSAHDLGAYDYSQTIMQIAVPILYMAIWEAVLKYVISCEDIDRQNEYIGSAFFLSFLSTAAMILFIAVFHFITPLPYPILVCIMMIVYTYCMLLQYCSRSLGKNSAYVVSGIMSTVINFLCIFLFVVILKKGLWGLYISYISGQAAGCLILFIKLKFWTKISYIHFYPKTAKILLYFSIPMSVNLASGWLINGAGRIIINMNLGNEANGLYSYANKFGSLVTMVTGVISMALMEEFYIRMNQSGINHYFSQKCNQIWELILSVFSFVLPLIGIYYVFIQNTEYYVSLKYVPVCIMSACISSFATNVGGVFQIKNIMHYAFLTTLAGGAVTVAAAVLSVGRYGVAGVVGAQLLGAAAMLLARYAVAHKLMKYSINYGRTVILLFFICIDSFLLLHLESIYEQLLFFLINTCFLGIFHINGIRGIGKKYAERKRNGKKK